MFRQRLKGGHKVGSGLKPSTFQSQNVNVGASPVFQTSHADTQLYSPLNSRTEESWNAVSSSANYPHCASQNTPVQTNPLQTASQFQNGANAQNQGYDEWSWGNEENWTDWGNESSSINSKNYNPPQQHSLNYQPQTFHTESNSMQYGSEGLYSSDQQKTIVSEQQANTFMSNSIDSSNEPECKLYGVNSGVEEEGFGHQSIQGHEVLIDYIPKSISEDLSQNNNKLNAVSYIENTAVNSGNSKIYSQQEQENDYNTIIDSHNNAPLTKIGDYFNSSKKEVSEKLNSNQRLSTEDGYGVLESNSDYHSEMNYSKDEKKPELFNQVEVTESLKSESKPSIWDETIYPESNLQNDKNLEGKSVCQSLNNCFEVHSSSEILHTTTSEPKNLISTQERNLRESATHNVNTINKPESEWAQTVTSWGDEWDDGWEIKQLESEMRDDTVSTVSNSHGNSSTWKSNAYEQADISSSVNNNQHSENTNSVPERPKTESISEVTNIQVLDQELQGIFSVPSDSSLVINAEIGENLEQKDAYLMQENHSHIKEHSEDLMNTFANDNSIEYKHDVISDDIVNSNVAIRHQEILALEDEQDFSPNAEKISLQSPNESLTQTIFDDHVTTNEEEDLYDDKFVDINANSSSSNLISSTPPLGPSGNIPNFHARKGSPFQPPVSRRSALPQQQLNITGGGNVPQPCMSDLSVILDQMPPERNPILSNIPPPEQNIKLCVVGRPSQLTSYDDLDNSLMQQTKPIESSEIMKINPLASHGSDIPPAHLNNMQSKFEVPKVRMLGSMNDTPTSPSVLDLSTYSIQNQERQIPSFKRMVPGESSKGESAITTSYQLPVIVPAMPTGRVVTGNANPQPVPSVRNKQEPNEIRAPPDGPDTGAMRDESLGVIPPIRSETIGSEDLEIRVPRLDRRDDERQSEREKENQRDYYSDRRKDGYYPNDSPHRMKPRDRKYDTYYGERRYGRRAPYDEVDDEDDVDGDERKFSEGIHERRRKAYRDELERYSERDRNMNIEKRRNRNRDARYSHEDEDMYYEDHSSDRSRPSSRSSSFGNLESEMGPGSHTSHIDEYYDRGSKARYRDKSSREPFRDYSQYKKREFKDQDSYDRGYNSYHEQRYGSREMYDPHSYYYYYQKYLEQQHPYYREYYRQFYGRYGYPGGDPPVDDKASTRSGRSSINEEIKKSSLSSHFPQDFNHQPSVSAYESAIYPEQYSFNCKSFASGDVSRVPSVTDEVSVDTQHRMSPHLYTGPHLRASFTSGGKLLLVLPNDPKEGEKATVQLRNVQKMLAVDSDFETRVKKLSLFPGPLTIKETHKDVVLRFCEEQALQAMKQEELYDKDSVLLMWQYLSLLVKQNGNVCGADLASLLIKGRCNSSTTSGETGTEEELNAFHREGVRDESRIPPTSFSDEAELVKKFTELLCLGRKKEAVDYAIQEKLWGYAMMLAAKMDSITHARVMASFMQTIPSTDVLHTLMQHLSNKKPEVSRNYHEEKWGDWRLHLAMMVSNPTGNVQKDRASIIALGDTLTFKHRHHAAHICYLAGEAEWGSFSIKDSKLVLIGSSPRQPFQLFASDDAIQCTEIFEFAKSLDSNNPMFFKFQSYKLIYAYRLAEFGFPNEALRYCQIITEAIIKEAHLFQVDFIGKVLELASQLKYHDVHYQMGEGEVSDMPDPDWLQYLNHILQTLQYKAKEKLIESTAAADSETNVKESEVISTPEIDYQVASRRNSDLTRAISRSSDYANLAPHETFDPPIEHINYIAPPVQSDHAQGGSNYISANVDNKEVTKEGLSYQSLNSSTCEPQPNFDVGGILPSQQTYSQPISETPELYNNSVQPDNLNQPVSWQPEFSATGEYEIPSNQVFQPKTFHGTPYQYNVDDQMNVPPPVDNMVKTPLSAEEDEYWKMMSGKLQTVQETEQEVDEIHCRGPVGHSEPTSLMTIPEVKEDKEGKETLKKSDDSTDGSNKHEDAAQLSSEELESKEDDKKSAGFLGSLFGGWRKGTNQAKLPDDKNPSIIWDEQKKKWVNKDGDENDDVAPPPPPSAMMGQPPPILRGGIKKSRYVDPLGDKGRTKTVIHSMSPPLPLVGATAPAQKIVANPQMPVEGLRDAQHPEALPVATSQAIENQSMIPRERYASSSSSVELYDELGYDTLQSADASNAIPMMNPVEPQQQPLFFNPAQFQAPQGGPSKPVKRPGPAKRSYNPHR